MAENAILFATYGWSKRFVVSLTGHHPDSDAAAKLVCTTHTIHGHDYMYGIIVFVTRQSIGINSLPSLV